MIYARCEGRHMRGSCEVSPAACSMNGPECLDLSPSRSDMNAIPTHFQNCRSRQAHTHTHTHTHDTRTRTTHAHTHTHTHKHTKPTHNTRASETCKACGGRSGMFWTWALPRQFTSPSDLSAPLLRQKSQERQSSVSSGLSRCRYDRMCVSDANCGYTTRVPYQCTFGAPSPATPRA